MTMPDLHHFAVTEQLKDETPVTIRTLRPDDRPRLIAAFRALDPQSVYTRFFEYRTEVPLGEIDEALAADFAREVALVATVAAGADEIIIGGARYFVFTAEGERRAEVAFTVEEDYQGRGLAGRLLGHLAEIARAQGIKRLVADVLPVNAAMLAVFARSGLPMTTERGEDAVQVTLSLVE